MKKFILIALAGVVGLSFSVAYLVIRPAPSTAYADDSVRFVTSSNTYSIPSSFVIPGSVFNEPTEHTGDKFGASIDLRISHNYMESLGISIKGVEDPALRDVYSSDGLIVTVTRPRLIDRDYLWKSQEKFDAITLSGQFSTAVFDFDERLKLYKVFSRIEGEVDWRKWELVTQKPSKNIDTKEGARGLWVASCNATDEIKAAACQFDIDVMDFYILVSGSELDYLALEQVKSLLANQFSLWKN